MSNKNPFEIRTEMLAMAKDYLDQQWQLNYMFAEKLFDRGKKTAEEMQEAMKMWSKLTVYAVGDRVEEVKEGDKVYVRTSALNMETVERIDIDGEVKLVLNEGDVVIIW